MHHEPTTPTLGPVVVLGDQATTAAHPQLAGIAHAHGRSITHHSTFPVGALTRAADLTANTAVVDAGASSATLGCPVWLPYPTDLGCEDNIRRLHLGLRTAGITLLVGPEAAELPDDAALSPLDKALRVEITYVQGLAAAITAAAAIKPLLAEITDELTAAAAQPGHVPSTALGWDQQVQELEQYARTLTEAGLTQTAIAGHFNGLGHRTRRGKLWTQVQISKLVHGRLRRGDEPPLAA